MTGEQIMAGIVYIGIVAFGVVLVLVVVLAFAAFSAGDGKEVRGEGFIAKTGKDEK